MADDDNDDVTVNSVESRITSIQVKRGNHDEPLALKTEGGLILLCTTTNRRRRIIILGVLVVVAVAISVGAIVIHVLRQQQQQQEGNNNSKKSNAVVAATLETNGEITSMDLAGNGRVMAVATTLRNYEPAIVYVYEWLQEQEQEQEWVVPRGQQIKTYNHQVEISLSYNGTSLAIGSAEGSTVCLYDLQNENEWTKTQCITQDNAGFGALVKYGNDRNILAACGFTFCQVYEYNQTTTKTTTTLWVPRGPRLNMSDSGFVMDLSMTNNGDTLLISTRNNTQIYSWHDDMSYYKPKGQPLQGRSWRNHYSWAILAPTNGNIVALQSLDEHRDPRMDGSGVIVVYVYEFIAKHKAWMQKRNEVATGYAFAISGNGSMVAVAKKALVRNEEEAEFSTSRAAGGHDSNTVGIFEWNNDHDNDDTTTTWSEIYSLSGNPRFLDIADSGKVVALANHDDIAVYRLESI